MNGTSQQPRKCLGARLETLRAKRGRYSQSVNNDDTLAGQLTMPKRGLANRLPQKRPCKPGSYAREEKAGAQVQHPDELLAGQARFPKTCWRNTMRRKRQTWQGYFARRLRAVRLRRQDQNAKPGNERILETNPQSILRRPNGWHQRRFAENQPSKRNQVFERTKPV